MPAMKLSRGMQQKLALACAVVVGASLLLLDEPTLGLDVETSYELRAYLRALAADEGRCVIISSHDLQLVSDVCGRVVIITGGRVAAADAIANLVGVFSTIAVRICLAEPLGPEADASLRDRFSAVQAIDAAGRSTIEVALTDSGAFYDFVALMEGANAVIERVEGAAPELEDVFLSILDRSRR